MPLSWRLLSYRLLLKHPLGGGKRDISGTPWCSHQAAQDSLPVPHLFRGIFRAFRSWWCFPRWGQPWAELMLPGSNVTGKKGEWHFLNRQLRSDVSVACNGSAPGWGGSAAHTTSFKCLYPKQPSVQSHLAIQATVPDECSQGAWEHGEDLWSHHTMTWCTYRYFRCWYVLLFSLCWLVAGVLLIWSWVTGSVFECQGFSRKKFHFFTYFSNGGPCFWDLFVFKLASGATISVSMPVRCMCEHSSEERHLELDSVPWTFRWKDWMWSQRTVFSIAECVCWQHRSTHTSLLSSNIAANCPERACSWFRVCFGTSRARQEGVS